MRFQVVALFDELEVMIADYTVSKKKLSFKTFNHKYMGGKASAITKHCYKAPAKLANGFAYMFAIDGVQYEVFYIGK